MNGIKKQSQDTEAPNNQTYQQPPTVQYVVAEKSLAGVGGWLLTFVILTGFSGLVWITTFFTALIDGGFSTADQILKVVFAPFLIGLTIGSVVLIAMQKKIAKWICIASIWVGVLYSILNLVVNDAFKLMPAGALIGSIVGGIAMAGLLTLYFVISKRVNATLTK